MQIGVVRPGEMQIGFIDIDKLDLDGLRSYIDGFIEGVRLPRGMNGYIDEEGKLKDLPVNLVGTALYHYEHGMIDVIVGPMVIVGALDDEGYDTSLTDGQIAYLKTLGG